MHIINFTLHSGMIFYRFLRFPILFSFYFCQSWSRFFHPFVLHFISSFHFSKNVLPFLTTVCFSNNFYPEACSYSFIFLYFNFMTAGVLHEILHLKIHSFDHFIVRLFNLQRFKMWQCEETVEWISQKIEERQCGLVLPSCSRSQYTHWRNSWSCQSSA